MIHQAPFLPSGQPLLGKGRPEPVATEALNTGTIRRLDRLRGGHEVDRNQELIALGAADVAPGLFQVFAISSSASRTPVAESAHAKSQLTGLVGAVSVALLLIFAPTLTQNVPTAALGAVALSACSSLVEIPGALRLCRLRRGELVSSLVCFPGVPLLGVIQGIFIVVRLAVDRYLAAHQIEWRDWDEADR